VTVAQDRNAESQDTSVGEIGEGWLPSPIGH